MKCIKNANIYIENYGVKNTSVSFNDRICNVGVASGDEIPLPNGAVVVAGFIDEHIHGAGGSDFMDGSVGTLKTISETLVKEGTVAFLATTVSASVEKTRNALRSGGDFFNSENKSGAEILGVHLEGPFISKKFKGAMNEQRIIPPDSVLLDEFVKDSGNRVKIVTYAPESDPEFVFLNALLKRGIVPSMGHTDATVEIIGRAVKNGLKNVTHTYNAMSPLHHREIGAVGSALLFDDLNCELIADELHVSVPAIELFLKCKPKDKIILITDSMRAKGVADGISEIGEQKVIVKGIEARLENGTLAGSVLKMNVAIRNLVKDLNVPFTDAVDFATINPAKVLGVDNDYGGISVGKKASFTVLDNDFNVVMTIVNGEIVYKG